MKTMELSWRRFAGVLPPVALVALAGVHVTCHQAILTAPGGSTITVFVNPEFIPANGGVSTVSALLIEPAGTPVADGTVVQYFTTLGRIEEQGRTNDGVSRVTLVSDARSGTAMITAVSGTARTTEPAKVTIGAANVAAVLVTANPTRLLDRRASRIVATVLDSSGNPVEGVAVVFKVEPDPARTAPPINEFMESRGAPVFSDNNGQASDVMRTNDDFGQPTRKVTVTATALTGASTGKGGSVDVTIN